MIMSNRPLSAVLGVQLCCPLCVFFALVSCFPQSLNGCTTRLCNLKRKAKWSHLKTLLEQRRMATWLPGIFSSHAPGEGSGGPRIPIKLKSCDPVACFGNIPDDRDFRISWPPCILLSLLKQRNLWQLDRIRWSVTLIGEIGRVQATTPHILTTAYQTMINYHLWQMKLPFAWDTFLIKLKYPEPSESKRH